MFPYSWKHPYRESLALPGNLQEFVLCHYKDPMMNQSGFHGMSYQGFCCRCSILNQKMGAMFVCLFVRWVDIGRMKKEKMTRLWKCKGTLSVKHGWRINHFGVIYMMIPGSIISTVYLGLLCPSRPPKQLPRRGESMLLHSAKPAVAEELLFFLHGNGIFLLEALFVSLRLFQHTELEHTRTGATFTNRL